MSSLEFDRVVLVELVNSAIERKPQLSTDDLFRPWMRATTAFISDGTGRAGASLAESARTSSRT